MQTLPISKPDRRTGLNLALTIIQRIEKPLTLADIDTSDTTEELDHLIGKYGGGHCTSFEFNDDNRKHGCRCLEYNIVTQVYTGGYDRDEDGITAETEKYKCTIWVPVHEEMSLEQIARNVAKEIRDIDGNRFA